VGTAVFKEKLLCVTSITQVLEAVLRKMCSTQINVGVKMFRNSVKNRFKSHFSKFVYLRKTKQRGFAPGVEQVFVFSSAAQPALAPFYKDKAPFLHIMWAGII